ncbi:MAG TPA: rhodanese-like domain-containing protein [Leptolyngbya sp.]|nr:rhodanese-like domain-containing protein [Leptolyngbya sp.]
MLLNLVKALIRLKFPDVPRMSIVELAQKLQETAHPQPLILDVRSEAEYAVSHLAAAKQLEMDSDLAHAEVLKNVAKDQQIIVYCSVGYRSAKVTQKLQQQGFQNALNLEGGLFQWANEDRSIVHDGQPTPLVHPYSASWGKLLRKQHRYPLDKAE